MSRRSFLADDTGAVAAEMALMTPMLIVLMFAGFEAGHFLWSEHKAVEGVRAAVRYASRLPLTEVCPTPPAAMITNVAAVARTGKLDTTAVPLVPGWSNNNQVTVTFNCGTYLATGIYTTYGANGATVTVSTNNLSYPSLFQTLGVITSSTNLNARSSAAVIGI